MPLFLANGEEFAVGATHYEDRPATSAEKSPRIVLTVALERYTTTAFIDTGGVYLICAPTLAALLHINPHQVSELTTSLSWRGLLLKGALHRVPLTFYATEGLSLTVEVVAFVPQLKPGVIWPDEFPCVLGMQECLEFIRFAIDPSKDTFYFGELANN